MIGPDLPPHLLAQSSSHPEDDNSDSDIGPAPPIGPIIPPSVSVSQKPPPAEEEEDDEDDYAPALPPELAAARASTSKKVLGPAFPPSVAGPYYGDDDDDDDVGPRPLPAGYVIEEKDGVQEFLEREERRRKQLEEASKPKAPQREEWMLVPPSSSDLLASIDPTKLTRPRKFAPTAKTARDADNSLWTETPAERQQRIADEVAGKRRRATDVEPEDTSADARKRRKYEEEVRRGVEQHTKTRGPALLKQHEHMSTADEAEKKRKGDEDEPPAFWDHGRDMGIGGRLMDDKTRNKFISEAKGLGDRFGSGKSGGFL
ncbi:hypothetical protein K466DRAFT_209697 [Polyporus arcularius HHB13444]|uniref:DUF3752 domain-containing protein n=1 Tax=Polyporus arcularius HHB13444 TaxID=1314778 RepID=A0A5C3P9F2_9APHY|nr:hypothetical protein K466DRAFT_209697 [Polyporus arcularius HHB13444]